NSRASMGPRVGYRGKAAWGVWVERSQAASMGPRVGYRGKTLPPPTSAGAAPALQWGRGLVTAERMTILEDVPGYDGSFNGAAGWLPRKDRPCGDGVAWWSAASMGPRVGYRG